MVIFWISDGHFPMSPHNKNNDIEHGPICLWHDQLMTVKTLENSDSRIRGTISVIIFLLLKVFFTCCLSDFKQPGVHFGLIWRCFGQHLPTENFFGKSICQYLALIVF